MIKNVDNSQLEYIANYTYSLNKIPKHKCKAFPSDYNSILNHFKKIINHPNDELLISVKDNNILGVLALLVEPKDMYLEFVGGVFAKNNYQIIANEFFNYINNKYRGYYLNAAYPKENIDARIFMESIGANLLSYDYEYKLNKRDYVNLPESDNIVNLNMEYYEEFIEFHNKFNSDAYWTGEKLIDSLNKFNIFIALENNKIIGSAVISNFNNKLEEVYFLNTLRNKQNPDLKIGLLNKAIKQAFGNGAEELLVMIENDKKRELVIYEELGFKKADTCLTYAIEI